MTHTAFRQRWYRLRPHAEQRRLWESAARFKVIPAGRRSGKTEAAKRRCVSLALRPQRHLDARYALCAPTYQQGKRIFWSDLKKLLPDWSYLHGKRRAISESELSIRLITGAEIVVAGLDKPERIEGSPLDWVGIDEIANCKPGVWAENIRPMLSERQGQAWLFGVPESRNFYYDLSVSAQEDETGLWDYFTWPSSDILPAEEITLAKAELDAKTFAQEYCASFETFGGRCYYAFDRAKHTASLPYYDELPLILAFDFNVSPGVCGVVQPILRPAGRADCAPELTGIVDEIYIAKDSNTKKVCDAIKAKYGSHAGDVFCYGDATGGASGTAKISGSDWDLIRSYLRPVFGDRLKFRVPRANPRERARVNAVNSRLESADGTIHMLVDPVKAPNMVKDLEGVTCNDDGSIDKTSDKRLTHISDALGYYVHYEYPTTKHITQISVI